MSLACLIACSPCSHNLSSADEDALVASVKEFVEEYLSYYEKSDVEGFINCFDPNVELFVHNEDYSLEKLKESIVSQSEKRTKKEDLSIVCSVDDIKILVNSGSSVTAMFSGLTIYHNKWRYKDYETQTLKMVDGKWKIVSAHMSSTINPIIFDENIVDEFKIGEIGSHYKYNIAKNHMYTFIVETISLAKSKGLSVNDYATGIGDRFATFWDKDKGVSGFIEGNVKNFQAFSSQLEILERDATNIKMKYPKEIKGYLTEDVSEEDFEIFFRVAMERIADYMGATSSFDVEDEFYIVTIGAK